MNINTTQYLTKQPENQVPAIRPSYYSRIAFLHLVSKLIVLHVTMFITGMPPPDCILHLYTTSIRLALIKQAYTAQAYEQGGGAAAPPDSGKTVIFQAKAKFFEQKPTAKIEKNVFIKRKKELILSSEKKCPKSGIFTARQHSLLCRALYQP